MMTRATAEQLNGLKFDIKLEPIDDEFDSNHNVQRITKEFSSSSRCKICLKPFECRSHIRKHMKDKHYNSFECDICHRKFSTLSSMKSHLMKIHVVSMTQKRNHSNLTKFTCRVCEESFSQLRNLKTHERREHVETCYPLCTGCTYHSVSLLKCELCGKRSKTLEDLERHLQLYLDDKPYKCVECTAAFKEKYNLNNHMRSHSNELSFRCELCHQDFKHSTSLRRHVKIHQ